MHRPIENVCRNVQPFAVRGLRCPWRRVVASRRPMSSLSCVCLLVVVERQRRRRLWMMEEAMLGDGVAEWRRASARRLLLAGNIAAVAWQREQLSDAGAKRRTI